MTKWPVFSKLKIFFEKKVANKLQNYHFFQTFDFFFAEISCKNYQMTWITRGIIFLGHQKWPISSHIYGKQISLWTHPPGVLSRPFRSWQNLSEGKKISVNRSSLIYPLGWDCSSWENGFPPPVDTFHPPHLHKCKCPMFSYRGNQTPLFYNFE